MSNEVGHNAVQQGGPLWLRRLFLVQTALWMVAQTHLGSFIGTWSDTGHWPGNICWLMICYCIGHLLLGWGISGLRRREVPGDALFLLAMVGAAELLWQVMVAGAVPLAWAGLPVFLMQPFLVLGGFAVTHRTPLSYR